MKERPFNIFEGCRRVVRIIAVAVIFFGAWAVMFPSKYATVSVYTDNKITLASESCPPWSDDKPLRITSDESPIENISINICFGDKFREALNAGYTRREIYHHIGLIPTGITPFAEFPLAGQPAVSEIVAAQDNVRADNHLIKQVNGIYDKKQMDKRIDSLKHTAAAVAILFAFSFIVGWVIRGFLGIPRRRDFRV